VRITVLNAGSATVKAAFVEVDARGARVLGRGAREVAAEGERERAFRDALAEAGALSGAVDAVGHRVVHGGRTFSAPVRVDAEVERAIDDLARLAPQHNPPALEGIRLARELFPDRPAVAVFDTAFHAGRAPESQRYALPWELSDALGLARYGFHGLAHASLVESLAEAEGRPEADVTAVTLQLGAGCSACAVESGRSVETSMGFSPLEGLPMATRPGDVDPSAVLELLDRGRSPQEVRDLLTRESGLKGLAGDADLRRVLAAEAAGSERARVAVALFVRRIVATVGGYLTLLGGRGAVVFGGGIGTHSADIRRRVARGLEAWQVALDLDRNDRAGARGLVSRPGTRPVYVFETDEERRIARSAYELLGRPRGGGRSSPVTQ
jgi:acetate kinase